MTIQRLVLLNLGLVAIQALSAGFLMSGHGPSSTIHAGVARALPLGALIQAVAGYTRRYWLHVPIGVGLFGGLIRQTSGLDKLRRTGTRES